MTESVLSAPQSSTSPTDAAVAICTDAWTRAHHAALKSHRGEYQADAVAAAAYCRALPSLSGVENIRAFIACVAQGLATGVIEGATASRLLYAAQVAKSALKAPNVSARTTSASQRAAASEKAAL